MTYTSIITDCTGASIAAASAQRPSGSNKQGEDGMKIKFFGMVIVVVVALEFGFVRNVSAQACTPLVPPGMTLSQEAQSKIAADPDPQHREALRKGLLVAEALKQGLIQPKPRFIQWTDYCEAFNPDTVEFEDLSPEKQWRYGLSEEEQIKIEFTAFQIQRELISVVEEGKFPNDDAGDKAFCAELHKRAEAMEVFGFISMAGQQGECVDPLLSLPNLRSLGIGMQQIVGAEAAKLVVSPKLDYLAYDSDFCPDRNDYAPYYPGPKITCKSGHN